MNENFGCLSFIGLITVIIVLACFFTDSTVSTPLVYPALSGMTGAMTNMIYDLI